MSSSNWTTDFLNQLNNAGYYTLNKSACRQQPYGKSKAITGNSLQNWQNSKMCVG